MEKSVNGGGLNHWWAGYMRRRASEIFNFHCIVCRSEIKGVSMYEHWKKCSPEFFLKISMMKENEEFKVG